jgi:hypothetical protein
MGSQLRFFATDELTTELIAHARQLGLHAWAFTLSGEVLEIHEPPFPSHMALGASAPVTASPWGAHSYIELSRQNHYGHSRIWFDPVFPGGEPPRELRRLS